MANEPDNTKRIAEESLALSDATNGERALWLTPHRWKPGQSGNPSGRPRDHWPLPCAAWVSNPPRIAPSSPSSCYAAHRPVSCRSVLGFRALAKVGKQVG